MKIFCQILVLILEISIVGSQSTPSDQQQQLQNGKFSPPVAIVIVVLVVALFFMGFFSIYIRQCTDHTNNPTNNSVRNALAIARRANANSAAEAARGLEPTVIETFPMFSYAEVKDHKIGKGALECAVCLNEFGDDETLRLIPKCDHVFHPECIDAWLQHHVTCPVCRSDLTPQAGDQPYSPPQAEEDPSQVNPEDNTADDVALRVDPEEEVKPAVNRIWSFKYMNRPPRTQSVNREGKNNMDDDLGKFRSHSTGHSLVQPGENLDRFTLVLPQEIRNEMMNRALLNRAKSVAAVLPRNGSSGPNVGTRRWYSTRFGNRSNKGASSFHRIEPQLDRWRKPTKVTAAEKGETSTATILKLPSFTCLAPKNVDEMSLIHAEPVQAPV